MKYLLAIGLVVCGGLEAAAEPLVLRPGHALPVSVTLDKRVNPGPLHSIQYMGGVVGCEMPPPGTEKGLPCPMFGVAFAIQDNLEVSAELGMLSLQQKPEATGAKSTTNLWLDSDRKLRYKNGALEFELDISSYFLPGTVVRRQWGGTTASSDILFLVSETCDDLKGCRSGLWFFPILKDRSARTRYVSFRPSLVPLLGKVDWRKLETSVGYGLQEVNERLAVLLPFEGAGVPVVAWVARFVDSPNTGITELHFDVYPAEWAEMKKD